jgi:glucan phosphoethanolaminetransferase (alkaline phosphatase superfamily)
MTDGLILLVFLGVLIAFLIVRARRRLGVASTGRTWLMIIIACVLVGLVLWASATQGK